MKYSIFLFIMCLSVSIAGAQRVVGDCTIKYRFFKINDPNNEKKLFGTKTLYIKGNQVRTDFENKDFTQTNIYNGSTNSAIILKSVNGHKFVSNMDSATWHRYNEKYMDAEIAFTNDTKIILGYHCKKALISFGATQMTIFYTDEMSPSIAENPILFKNIPGFILSCDQISDEDHLYYTAVSINMMPIMNEIFQPSLRGYRLLDITHF